MNRLVRTELLKLRTTRTTMALAVAGVAVAVLLGAANAAIAGDQGAPALGSAAWVENVLGVSTTPAAVAVLLGVLLSAGEHQHGTITTTFLITPVRHRVVATKAVAASLAGAALAFTMVVVAALATVPTVVGEGAEIDAFHRGTGLAIAGLVLASALLGALGVLLGLLVRSQVAALVVVAAWALILEGVVDVLAGGGLRRWLPGGAAADLAGNGSQPLWLAAAVVAAWTAAVALVTTPLVGRRDIA